MSWTRYCKLYLDCRRKLPFLFLFYQTLCNFKCMKKSTRTVVVAKLLIVHLTPQKKLVKSQLLKMAEEPTGPKATAYGPAAATVSKWFDKFLSILILKFIYSEKATKFCEIFIALLSYVMLVKSKLTISQNFVAFSEY